MTVEKKLEALETELKLMKSELKLTLVDVRDFLLTLKLPPPPVDSLSLEGEGGGGGGGGGSSSSRGQTIVEFRSEARGMPPVKQPVTQPVAPMAGIPKPVVPETLLEVQPRREAPRAPEEPQVELTGEVEESPEAELPEEKLPGDSVPKGQRSEEMKENIPQINMLANLIRWVSQAKRQLGKEQLPVFLQVYAISGNLPLEVKEVILELAEVTGEESAPATGADVWSQLILELHGILAGGGSALRPIKLAAPQKAEPETAEAQKPKPRVPKPLKLKLVLPTEDGEKEFSLSLTPEAGGNGWDSSAE